MESVVCNHLSRLLYNNDPNQFDYTTRLFYWKSRKKKEVDLVARLRDGFLPIELKYQPKVQRIDVLHLDFEKGGKSLKGVIITKDIWAQRRTHIEMPASIFLLLS